MIPRWLVSLVLVVVLAYLARDAIRGGPQNDPAEALRVVSIEAHDSALASWARDRSTLEDSLRAARERAVQAREQLEAILQTSAVRRDTLRIRAAAAGAEFAASMDSLRASVPAEIVPLVDAAETQATARVELVRLEVLEVERVNVALQVENRALREESGLLVRARSIDAQIIAEHEAKDVLQEEQVRYWQDQAPGFFERNWGWIATGVGVLGFLVGVK